MRILKMEERIMSKKMPDIHLIQKRIANTSIGAPTLRNQGTNVVKRARDYLEGLDLRQLRSSTEGKFTLWLDNNTLKLVKDFRQEPENTKDNWGAARKAINIFLENAFYDKFLSRAYKLGLLEKILEVPLDNQVAEGMKEDLKNEHIDHNLPRFPGIKKLTPKVSEDFQQRAKELSRKLKIARIYLDLKYWRGPRRNY